MDVRAERVLPRQRAEVAAYVEDWRHDPVWIGGISDAELVTPGAFGPGSQVQRVASFLGKRVEYVLEVVEHVPHERLAMRSVRGPFPMEVTYTFADAGAGTRMGIEIGGDASGFYRLATPLMSRQVRSSITGDLARLEQVLTDDGDAAPS
jgi:hypothetical protein